MMHTVLIWCALQVTQHIANLYNILERPRSLPSMCTPSAHLKMNWFPMDCTSSGSYGIYTVPVEVDTEGYI